LNTGCQHIELAEALMDAFNQNQSVPFFKLFQQPISVALPAYPFDRHRHWIDAQESAFHSRDTIIDQHRIKGQAMAPASLSIAAVLEHCDANILTGIVWKNIISSLEGFDVKIEHNYFQVHNGYDNRIYCEGYWEKAKLQSPNIQRSQLMDAQNAQLWEQSDVYQRFSEFGYQYGPYYQSIKQALVSHFQIHSVIEIAKSWDMKLSPVLIDAALQTALLWGHDELKPDVIKVPFYINSITIYQWPDNNLVFCDCYPQGEKTEGQTSSTYNIALQDVNGEPLLFLEGVISMETTLDKLVHSSTPQSTTSPEKGTYSVNKFELN